VISPGSRGEREGGAGLNRSMEAPFLSADFNQLYCDATVFESFSAFNPISFRRVLPFQHQNEGVDDAHLLRAEEAHRAEQNDSTRAAIVDEYSRCGLLGESEAGDLRGVIDFYGADFFELMGLAYANAGKFRCALRWYRELINRLETLNPNSCSDTESVYASVGYCLYSLNLFEEAIAWSKACIGPRHMADAVCRALIDYEVQPAGGTIRTIERSGPRTRYTVTCFGPDQAIQATPRLKAAMKSFAPFQDVYIDWIHHENACSATETCDDPVKAEFDASSLVRHKMNLIFSTCSQADALTEKGYCSEAKRLLFEAAMAGPEDHMVLDRLRQLA
jgi:hypothetical protein